jgi:hypothetical protein
MKKKKSLKTKSKKRQETQAKLLKEYTITVKWIENLLDSIAEMTPEQRKKLARNILNWRNYRKW